MLGLGTWHHGDQKEMSDAVRWKYFTSGLFSSTRPQVCNQRRIPSHWLCLLLRKREGDGRGGKRNVLSFLKIPRTLTTVNLHFWQPGVHWDGWRKQVHRQVKVLGNASQNAIDQIILALNDDFCPEDVVIFLIVLIVRSLPSIFWHNSYRILVSYCQIWPLSFKSEAWYVWNVSLGFFPRFPFDA